MPEDIVAEVIEDLWRRRDALEEQLADPTFRGDDETATRELAEIEQALGLRKHQGTIYTGDVVTDYLIARHLSGDITPEDLFLTREDLERMHRGDVRRT